LALLEVVVHLDGDKMLPAYSTSTVSFDESLVADVLKIITLPPTWTDTKVSDELKAIGDEWVTSRMSLVLKVPSIIVPNETNYLINVSHPDADKLKFGQPKSFAIDDRLTKHK